MTSSIPENDPSGLPLRESARHPSPRTHRRVVIGHHLILHAYGHWLPNDPRGSGSRDIREKKLSDLGELHYGRRSVQPPRAALKQFYRRAEPRLDFPTLWFDAAKRQAVADACGKLTAENRYTVRACAVLRNHVHLCIRRHRDDALKMWNSFAAATADAVRSHADVHAQHPVWSARPYKVFLYNPEDARRVVEYIEQNPDREGLPRQAHPFVVAYDGFPFVRATQP